MVNKQLVFSKSVHLITSFLVLLFFFIIPSILWAVEYSESCGKEWEWRNPLPQGNDFLDLSWTKEQKQWVTVGRSGTILTSPNGIDWQVQRSGMDNWLFAIAWNGSQWLASGDSGTILSSPDGVSWQSQNSGTDKDLGDITWNGSQWLAVGSEGMILSSSDGVSWQAQSSGTDKILMAVAWNGSQWLAVGHDGIILSSPDGVNWEARSSGTDKILIAVAWNGSQWLAVGSEGMILSSPDGVNWQAQASGTDNILMAVAWNGNQWLAVGGNAFSGIGIILSSPDGINWQSQSSETENDFFYEITWNGIQWLIAGSGGTIVSSPDGVSWQTQSSGTNNWLRAIASNGSQWLVVGSRGTIVSSPDGVSWQRQSSGTENGLYSIAWNGSQWLAVGYNGTILTSPNGIDWQVQRSGTENGLYSIAWNGSQWLAVGYYGKILSSPDGVSWQAQSALTDNGFDAIAWNGSQWLAVGYYGKILSSPDGVSWQAQSSGTDNALNSITWNGSQWLTVGDDGTILSSPDGVSWQAQSSGTDKGFDAIAWNGSQWLAVGESGMILSSDCYQTIEFKGTHALIINGIDTQDHLWESATINSNDAYRTLVSNGIDKSQVRYFNTDTTLDADNDGASDVFAIPSLVNIQSVLSEWGDGADKLNSSMPLLVYIITHGLQDKAALAQSEIKTDILTATELNSLLDALQRQTGSRVTTLYDGCYAGSFMDNILNPQGSGFERVNIFSTLPDKKAIIAGKGLLSFSSFFWGRIANGYDVRSAYRSAQVAMRSATDNYQESLLDDNGDGQQTKADGLLALDTYLTALTETSTLTIVPKVIGQSTTESQSINAGASITLSTQTNLPDSEIKRVWAVAIPPDIDASNDSLAISNLPVIEFEYNALNGRYEATTTEFNKNGQYTLSYYVQSTDGIISGETIIRTIKVSGQTSGAYGCTTETAEISLNDWVIHIGSVDYIPHIGNTSVYYDVGLKYRTGSNPYIFDVTYAGQENGHANCSDTSATFDAKSTSLTIPSIKITETGSGDLIWDNLSFKLVNGEGIGFEFISASPR